MAPGRQGFYNLSNADGYSVREVDRMGERVNRKTIPALDNIVASAWAWGTSKSLTATRTEQMTC